VAYAPSLQLGDSPAPSKPRSASIDEAARV
jgi:hypothetical protein